MRSKQWIWAALLGLCVALTAAQAMRSEAPRPAVAVEKNDAAPANVVPAHSLPPKQPAPLPARAGENVFGVEQAVQKARAAGAGEDETYRLRAAALSTQTIALLTEREQAEKQWMLRVQAWRAEREKLNPGDAAAQQALRGRLFDADEQTRLDAYDYADAPQLILR